MKRSLMILALLSTMIVSGCTAGPFDLADTHWELVFYGPGSNLSEVIDGTRVTLNFSAKADSIGGSAGCNSYGGDVDIDGKKLTVSGLYHTEMYCLNPPGIWEQEVAFLDLLGKMEAYSVENGRLTIECRGEGRLIFDATR